MAENKEKPYDFTHNYGSIRGEQDLKNVQDSVNNLVKVIADTGIYRDFKEAREKVSAEELEKIGLYKKLRLELINRYTGEDDFRAKELYRKLMLNADTRNYILCEKRLSNLIAGVYDEIGEELEVCPEVE